MNLSLEERKRKLIEEVCASCSGGGGDAVDGAGADPGEGIGGDDEGLVKALSMIRKAKAKKKVKEDGT